ELDPEAVLLDEPGDGKVWGSSRAYKASFDGTGATFIPFFGSDAPRNYPVRFALAAVRAGSQMLPLVADAKTAVAGRRVTTDHGSVREVYELSPRSMEQLFVFDAPPA